MKSKKDRLNICILGMSSITSRSVIPVLSIIPNKLNLKAIASIRNQDKIPDSINSMNIYDSYKKAIEVQDIDAVYIALPNALHYEWIKKALKRNLHVICEKPFTCDYEQSKELINLARNKNLVLMETFQFRFHNQFNCLNKFISNKILGDLRSLKVSFCFPKLNDRNIRYSNSLGGGSLLDAGCYGTKLSHLLLGDNLKVEGAILNHSQKINVDIWGSAFLIDDKKGVSSYINFGFDNFYQCNFELLGKKGKLTTNRIFTAPIDYSPKMELETESGKQIINIDPDNQFLNMFLYFHKLISANNLNLLTKEYNEILINAKLITSIFKKAKIKLL